ncbi:TetR/AcrR family transcriptional regulator [Demequina mangrovi]|uniref:Transcriptional regulator, TetR family n=1 Tax=Demequina mangrovi TaxID=1043493 RepID=A0A1H7AF91_9MICO|nr:TetR family transcriptional regulator [Demequina mangrovi]SEJ62557.1 transcriptional regulator, TetR family [Demequina mangrovi]
MARWAPGARERLQQAALDAFETYGFDATTVASIAAVAGVTERTFYRHFADKREVLFDPEHALETAFSRAAVAQDPDIGLRDLIRAVLRDVAVLCPEEARADARRRGAIIASDAGLQEREALKLQRITAALERAFQERGESARRAQLAAGLCVLAFRTGHAAWLAEGETRSLDGLCGTMLASATLVLAK